MTSTPIRTNQARPIRKLLLASACAVAISAPVAAETLPIDIVFMIDESGSMYGPQQAVKDRLNDTIIPGFNAEGVDYTFGLVGYGSSNSGGAPRILTTFTDGVGFSVALESLELSGGTEPGFDATVLAMDASMGFRTSAGVCAVIVTDEASNGDVSTQAAALAELNARSATFFAIINPGDGATNSQYGPDAGSLAAETGGETFSISDFTSDAQPVLTALIDSCVEAVEKKKDSCGCPETPAECQVAAQEDASLYCGSNGTDVFYGTSRDDTFCGYNGTNVYYAFGGNDCIEGGDNRDVVYASAGDDSIFIKGGIGDYIHGGGGTDRCVTISGFKFSCEE